MIKQLPPAIKLTAWKYLCFILLLTCCSPSSVDTKTNADSVAVFSDSSSVQAFADSTTNIKTYFSFKSVSDTSMICEVTGACVIVVESTQQELDSLEKQIGDEDFSTVMDDEAYYLSEMSLMLDSLNILQLHTSKRYLKLISSSAKFPLIDTRAVKDFLPMILFNPSKEPKVSSGVDLTKETAKEYFK